jgi:hypothetical protein
VSSFRDTNGHFDILIFYHDSPSIYMIYPRKRWSVGGYKCIYKVFHIQNDQDNCIVHVLDCLQSTQMTHHFGDIILTGSGNFNLLFIFKPKIKTNNKINLKLSLLQSCSCPTQWSVWCPRKNRPVRKPMSILNINTAVLNKSSLWWKLPAFVK